MEKPDLREKGGERAGVRQTSDRRLFMQLLAFGDCRITPGLIRALEAAEIEAVLYEDVNDSTGVALLTWSVDPAWFTGPLRALLQYPPFSELTFKPEYTMLGRSYAIGHEPDLDDWLLDKPRRSATAAENRWAVWYPLRRTGAFTALPYMHDTLPFDPSPNMKPVVSVSVVVLTVSMPASMKIDTVGQLLALALLEPGKLNAAADPGI